MKFRDLTGYLFGLIIFVILIPLIMCRVSGDVHPGMVRIICLAVMATVGIGLSIWSIIYMKNVGKGNPMDAFNHEVAPRTVNLMTDGPYKLCRNPMLLGVIIYYLGILIFLWSWQAVIVFVIYLSRTIKGTQNEKTSFADSDTACYPGRMRSGKDTGGYYAYL